MRIVSKLVGNPSTIFYYFSRPCCLRYKSKMSVFSDESSDSFESTQHLDNVKKIQEYIPRLLPNLHKGQCGRVGVIGGSFEYSGAPFFAAISALKLGADLAHVFCCREAGPVIKSYSPELIVHPILDSDDAVKLFSPWLERLHVVVIGPGMGRSAVVLRNVADIINHCKTNTDPSIPLIIDADAVYLITEDPHIIKDYGGPLILTPNSAEFSRMCVKLSEKEPHKIALQFNAVLCLKGATDFIINGIHGKTLSKDFKEPPTTCRVPGSFRRCGGQGDILSGCIGTFVAWLSIYMKATGQQDLPKRKSDSRRTTQFEENSVLFASAVYGGCVVTRTASKLAYELHGRGMIASDMITQIGKAFRNSFGQYMGN